MSNVGPQSGGMPGSGPGFMPRRPEAFMPSGLPLRQPGGPTMSQPLLPQVILVLQVYNLWDVLGYWGFASVCPCLTAPAHALELAPGDQGGMEPSPQAPVMPRWCWSLTLHW